MGLFTLKIIRLPRGRGLPKFAYCNRIQCLLFIISIKISIAFQLLVDVFIRSIPKHLWYFDFSSTSVLSYLCNCKGHNILSTLNPIRHCSFANVKAKNYLIVSVWYHMRKHFPIISTPLQVSGSTLVIKYWIFRAMSMFRSEYILNRRQKIVNR